MRFLSVGGSTRTAAIRDKSAAGAKPALMVHTPVADAEILEYGRTVRSPVVPVSATGCPTPAVIGLTAAQMTGLNLAVPSLLTHANPFNRYPPTAPSQATKHA